MANYKKMQGGELANIESISEKDKIEKLVNAAIDAIVPEQRLTVDEWSDEYRILSKSTSSEYGPWKTSRFPFLKRPMFCMSPQSIARHIAAMKGSQLGFTEILINKIFYNADHYPGPTLYVQKTIDAAKDFASQKLDPSIEVTPAVATTLGVEKSPVYADEKLNRAYAGGYISMGGANSTPFLRSKSIRDALVDEEDSFKQSIGSEGSPIALIRKRQANFPLSKLIRFSTPTIKETSTIEPAYEAGSKEQYYVPCPHCNSNAEKNGFVFVIEWENIKWSKELNDEGLPIKVWCQCPACQGEIEEHKKTWMLENGRWLATKKETGELYEVGDVEYPSFKINSLYSPLGFFSWRDAVEEFFEYKRTNDIALLQVFENCTLANSFTMAGQDVSSSWLMQRKEDYVNSASGEVVEVPDGVLVLTAGVDIQKDRIECFDEETEVLTKDGWKYFKDVNKENEIATVNVNKDKIEYQKPTRIINKKHNGDMIKIKSKTADILVTPNHRMLAYKSVYQEKPDFLLAKDLKCSHALKASVTNYEGLGKKYFCLDETFMETRPIGKSKHRCIDRRVNRWRVRFIVDGKRVEKLFVDLNEAKKYITDNRKKIKVRDKIKINIGNFAEFLGLFIAEGHYGRNYSVVLSQNKGSKSDHIDNLMSKIPLHVYRFEEEKRVTWKITCKKLYEYLEKNVGKYSYGKRIPREFLNYKKEILQRLFDGYHMGDGWIQRGKDRKEMFMMATASKQLSADLQELLIKLGYRTNVNKIEKQKKHFRDIYYVSQLNSNRIHNKTKRNGKIEETKEVIKYKGNVYCVTVPNRTLILRRNGKMFTAGNCEIVGWGLNNESWSIDYSVFWGNTDYLGDNSGLDPNTKQPTVWTELDRHLFRKFKGVNGVLHPIECTLIDSGYRSEQVHVFCRLREHRRIYPCKGKSGFGHTGYLKRPKRRTERFQTWHFQIWVDDVKDRIYQNFIVESPGPGYCHFPDLDIYDVKYFQGLTCENKKVKIVGGQKKLYWETPPGARNEPLDCRNYAFSALVVFTPNLEQRAQLKLNNAFTTNNVVKSIGKKPKKRKGVRIASRGL